MNRNSYGWLTLGAAFGISAGIAALIWTEYLALETVLTGLLWASLLVSCLLIYFSVSMTGRKRSDLEYQRKSGINGIRNILAIQSLRTHRNRIFVGITFATIAILLLLDAPALLRMIVNRVLFVYLPGSYAFASWMDEGDESAVLDLQLAADEAKQHAAAMVEANTSLQQITKEAVESLEVVARKHREEKGLPPIEPLASVVPEHGSPVTPGQEQTAETATLRARITAARLALDLPARTIESSGEEDTSVSPEVIPAIAQTVGDMKEAAEETLDAAHKTADAAEMTVDAITEAQGKKEKDTP